MNTQRVCLIILSAILFGAAACRDSLSAVSRAEHQGLVVEFEPICMEDDIWLSATISNSTSEPIQIGSGIVPWDFEPLGTHFDVMSSGKALTKKSFFPPVGRTGPVKLASHERRSGSAPIGFLFPEMKGLLAKQSVTVHWKYMEGLEGTLEIKRDPCAR